MTRKVKSVTPKSTGQRADGLPKMSQVRRKGGRKYGQTQDGRILSAGWIMDHQPPAPVKEDSRYPVNHPLWSTFVSWIATAGVVRKDLLLSHPHGLSANDWEQVWLTFLAGSMFSHLRPYKG